MSTPPRRRPDRILLFLLFGACLYLTFNMVSKVPLQSYHGVMWADGAGYYSYLPGFFIYDFDVDQYPEGIGEKTGNGFSPHFGSGKMSAKYTCGVALLQLPFFLITHALAEPLGYEASGFSPPYHYMLMIAANFYFIIGLFFLNKVLRRYYDFKVRWLSLLFLLAGTNLYYYVIAKGSFSHVYSFFLFACFLYYSIRFHEKGSLRYAVITGLVYGMIVLVRPTNMIIGLVFVFFRLNANDRPADHIANLVKRPVAAIVMLACFLLPFIPQLFYYKFLTGDFLYYSYGGESFSNLTSPRILKVWFSTVNGLFPYAPLSLFMLAGFVLMIKNRAINAWLYPLIFLIVSYIVSSWWSWNFGCAYGSRSFVEYFAPFSLALAYLMKKIFSLRSNLLKIILVLLPVCLSVFNLLMIYGFDDCWYGGVWDWQEYFNLIFG